MEISSTLYIVAIVFALLLATAPALSHAADLDAALACSTTAHSFFTDLAGQQLIDPKPMRVESNSINAFWPSRGAKLTAFGFPVIAQQDNKNVLRGAGLNRVLRMTRNQSFA